MTINQELWTITMLTALTAAITRRPGPTLAVFIAAIAFFAIRDRCRNKNTPPPDTCPLCDETGICLPTIQHEPVFRADRCHCGASVDVDALTQLAYQFGHPATQNPTNN